MLIRSPPTARLRPWAADVEDSDLTPDCTAALSVAAIAQLAAACGGGGGVKATGASEVSFTKAQALAYADAVNLGPSDLPGFREALRHAQRETKAGPFGAAAGSCESPELYGAELMGMQSPGFAHTNAANNGNASGASVPKLEIVRSGVYFFGTEALADQYLAASETMPFAACVKRLSAKEAKTITRKGSNTREALFSGTRISPLAWPLPGVQGYGLRMTARSQLGSSTGGPSNLYQDFISFVKGHALITLDATGSGQPVSTAAERSLLERLSSRSQAHAL